MRECGLSCWHGSMSSSSMSRWRKAEARQRIGSSRRPFHFIPSRHSQILLSQSTSFAEASCRDRRGYSAHKCHYCIPVQWSHFHRSSMSDSQQHYEEAWKTIGRAFLLREAMSRPCICGAGMAAIEWMPAVDNLLLLTSIALAYVAGIVTPLRDTTISPGRSTSERTFPTTSPRSEKYENVTKERDMEEHSNAKANDVWSEARKKLSSSYFGQNDEDIFQSPVLSLQAIAKGPRLRLLFLTLEQLHKKVDKLREESIVSESGWIELSSTLLCQTVVSSFRIWIVQEDSFERQNLGPFNTGNIGHSNTAEGGKYLELDFLPNLQMESLQDSDVMINYLTKSGKAELYADFLQFICFAAVRPGSCCKLNMFLKYAEAIVEDMMIAIADGVSILYLDLLSIENIQAGLPSVTIPELSSTRALERFRNEVAIRSWITENFESVTAMFEDYFLLWTLKRHTFPERRPNHNAYLRWIRNNCTRQVMVEAEGSELFLSRFEMPAKRIRELRALSGWRYFYSLFLEFSDVMGPLLRTLIRKLGEGLSFLLVCFIGRSLGLIYKGIRQSIGWTSD